MAHVLDDGKVEVHMPFEAPDQAADDVVIRFLPDIEKQIKLRKQAAETKQSINYSFQPLLFGKRYPLVKNTDDFCGFDPKAECFSVIPGLRQYQLKNVLKNCYIQIGRSVFSKRMEELSERMNVKYKRFQISPLAAPFGRCVERGELIELSWALAMTDHDFIDSVIVHELAHTIYDDHYSAEFIAFVNEFCPGYDDIDKRGADYEVMLRADGWIKTNVKI
jgi:predicted metal-dependent hydrolase